MVSQHSGLKPSKIVSFYNNTSEASCDFFSISIWILARRQNSKLKSVFYFWRENSWDIFYDF